MNLPTVKQLRYFIALEKHQHFGQAAASCFVSQSAFSTAIRELESILDLQLVDRTNKHVAITNIGRKVAEQARDCIHQIEGLVQTARSNQQPLTGDLRLGVIPTIAPFLLPLAMPKLREQFPDLRLYITEDITQRIYQRLMTGEFDVILVALPYSLRSVEVLPLFEDRFYLACRPDSQFTNPSSYQLEQLPPESILLLEDGHCLRDHALSACKLQDADQISRFAASSVLTLVQMVSADLGLSYLPEMVRHTDLLTGTDVKLWPTPDNGMREIGLAWRQGSARAGEFQQLGKAITAIHQQALAVQKNE